MHIIYLSSACTEEKYKELFEHTENKPGQAVMKYHRLTMEGLAYNGATVTAISSLPINRQNCRSRIIRKSCEQKADVTYIYPTVINLRFIKNLFMLVQVILQSVKAKREHKYEKTVLICDGLYGTVSIAALILSGLFHVKNVCILTDVPGIMLGSSGHGGRDIKRIQKFDSFIFLTQQMNDYVNIKSRPFIVQEGLVDKKMFLRENNLKDKFEKFTFMYTGSLKEKYGVKQLVEAFVDAEISDSELILCGDGDYVCELTEVIKVHPNVKYLGNMLVDDVVKLQLKADVLINPRFTSEEYTKYSFPSKNMEYMVSGTATMTTDLAGMPKEYAEYVLLITDETQEGYKAELMNAYQKGREGLHTFGLKTQKYVLEHKSNQVQTKKLIEFIEVKVL